MDIKQIATQLNFAHNIGSGNAGDLCVTLYSEVSPRKQGGQALLNLDSADCQCVGLAFAIMALCYDFGDKDINSVAAENAYYCLARSYIETHNTFVTPAIFSIMQQGDGMMNEKLISSWCDMAQKETGMPIGIMLGGNPFKDPRMEDFRQQAINFKDDIAYYALLQFYDIANLKYKIPTDLPYFIPQEDTIKSFLVKIKANSSFGKDNYILQCKEHFISVYEQCKDTLSKF